MEGYVTLKQAASSVGLKRNSIYYHLKKLGIRTQKPQNDRNAYILTDDAHRIDAARAKRKKRKAVD